MPTTIYDSSLITKRRQMKAESGNFINRIQNPVQPNTGYAPALGIWDQSIINDVKNGQMVYYRKGTGGCTTIDNGCPCQPLPDTVHSLRVPNAPTIIQIIPGDGQLTVVFTAPSTDGGSPITDHQYSLDGRDWQSVGATTASYVIPLLTNGRSYTIRKRSMNAMGVGSISAAVVATPGAPTTPTNIIVTPGDGQVSIAFTNISGGNFYRCIITPPSGLVFVRDFYQLSPVVVLGLTNGVSYSFQLQASNGFGAGWPSESIVATPVSSLPLDAPTNIIVTPGDGQLSVAFTAPFQGAPFQDYQYSTDRDTWISARTTTSPFTISGLSNGSPYNFQLRAVGIHGAGTPAVTGGVPGVPSAPTNIIITPGHYQVSVAFTPPFQGAPFQDYQYTIIPQPDGTYIWISAGTTTSPFTVSPLDSGTLYSIQVRAINTYGIGLASDRIPIYIEYI